MDGDDLELDEYFPPEERDEQLGVWMQVRACAERLVRVHAVRCDRLRRRAEDQRRLKGVAN